MTLLDSIRQHDVAEGTPHGQRVGRRCKRLIGAFDVDPLAHPLFHPHAPAPRTAAERRVAMAMHLLVTSMRNGLEDGSRSPPDVVVARVVAGVVVGERLRTCLDGRYATVGDEAREVLRMVHDVEPAAELWVLVCDRVETVWTCGHNGLGAVGL